MKMVKEFGPRKWWFIAKSIPGRHGKQSRERQLFRWKCYIAPSIRKETWTEEEEIRLLQAYQLLGSSWSKIRKFLPGRTDNAIKNHWHGTRMSKMWDMYKTNHLLQNPLSCVAATKYSDSGNPMQNKNTATTSEGQASTSDTGIGKFCNSNLADELTDIDMIVCGPAALVEMSGEDDD